MLDYTHVSSHTMLTLYTHVQHVGLLPISPYLLTIPMYNWYYYPLQQTPFLVAIVDYTHVHHVVHYMYQQTPCLVAIVDYIPMYTTHINRHHAIVTRHVQHVVHYTHQQTPCLVAIVDYTHVHHVVLHVSTDTMSGCYC